MRKNQHIIVACSGGIDSIVLAHILLKNGYNISLAHCNFQLRGDESNEDENFVKQFAKDHCIPLQTHQFDTQKHIEENKENTQITARKLRYNWFKELASSNNALIALGHHQDDQIETFYIQLLRGGGVRGLCAMEKKTGIYLRPLLEKTKEWIRNYAHFHQLSWREDRSNQNNYYQRNAFRNVLLSNHKKIGFQGLETLNAFKKLQNQLEVIAASMCKKWLSTTLLETWNNLPTLLKKEITYQLNIPRNQTTEIDKLAQNQVGSTLSFQDFTLFRERKGISIITNNVSFKKIVINELNAFPKEFDPNLFYVDAEKIDGNIILRERKKGDHFIPLGMSGKKRISKYLTDKRVFACHKSTACVIADNSKIVAVEFGVINQKVKINSNTKKIITLQILK
ncbi:MAG: tRNA lysidine(34) synthetase TilS [Lishizhenia sp.]